MKQFKRIFLFFFSSLQEQKKKKICTQSTKVIKKKNHQHILFLSTIILKDFLSKIVSKITYNFFLQKKKKNSKNSILQNPNES